MSDWFAVKLIDTFTNHQPNQTFMKKLYSTPLLTDYGDVAGITAADATNGDEDTVYYGSIITGHLNGSLDACVFGNGEPPPGTNCIP